MRGALAAAGLRERITRNDGNHLPGSPPISPCRESIVVDHPDIPADDAREAEFVTLLTSHQLDIYLYVHSLMPDPHEAADIIQGTNVVLWEKRHQFQMATDFRAWAFQIARYELSEQRARRKRKGVSFSDALIDELTLQSPSYTTGDDDLMDGLRRCVPQLAARDRELLIQRYSSQTTCESIAQSLGTSRPLGLQGPQPYSTRATRMCGPVRRYTEVAMNGPTFPGDCPDFRGLPRSGGPKMGLSPLAADQLRALADMACDGVLREDDAAQLEQLLHGNVEGSGST